MRIPRGKENQIAKYAIERPVIWEKRVNPHGRKCVVCGKPIVWVWRNSELWSSPFYHCQSDKCEKVWRYKTSWVEECPLNRPAFPGY